MTTGLSLIGPSDINRPATYDLFAVFSGPTILAVRRQIATLDVVSRDPQYDEIDPRIQTWARAGNTQAIPEAKIPPGIARDSEVDTRVSALVEDWAETGNASLIPAAKIPAPASGLNEEQVDARAALRYTDLEKARVAGITVDNETSARILGDSNLSDRINTNFSDITNLQQRVGRSSVLSQIRAAVFDWAETDNTDAIPADKLTNAPAGAQGPPGVQGPAGADGADSTVPVSYTHLTLPTICSV